MTINIEKKHVVIGAIFLAVALLALVVSGVAKNIIYMKRAKLCQEDIHLLYYASSILSAELHDVWSDYIHEDKKYIDTETGKWYEGSWTAPKEANLKYCSNFSKAIAEMADYYEKKGVNDYVDSLYSSLKELMTKMTPAPKKYADIHANINTLFHTAEAMYNCAVSPEGSLVSYTQEINSLSSDYKKQSSQVDIEIGELSEDDISHKELEALLKFF